MMGERGEASQSRPSKGGERALQAATPCGVATHPRGWLWGPQLALNGAWSPIFFGARRPGAALVEIALLGAAIVGYGVAAGRVDRKAGWMMVPYAAWVAFATALNAEVWRRN